ncbi:aromatic ring-hydroxylating dioxygenase subunit alpha [Microtetraspora fusca]|uniref:Aromatic ring-hydroxylating dioxygenase subunit alpha n=1 Tax=Microtetraspora fusca TaxID=1997 RepID=A0ABW6VD88_MICFU
MIDLDEHVDLERGVMSRKVFVDDDIYRLELERIFSRTWLFLAHESQLPKSGSFVSTYMGEDPVIVVRRSDGGIGAVLNSCRHRGMKVCRADVGTTRAFRCSYHGWTYGLDGDLVSVPNMAEGYRNELDMSRWGLLRVPRVESYKGLIFGTWDAEAQPVEEALGDITFLLDTFLDRRPGGTEVIGGVQKWVMGGNWKLAAEQFASDMYHSFLLHASAWQALAPEGADLSEMVFPSVGSQMTSQGSGGGWFHDPTGAGSAVLGPVLAADFTDPAVWERLGEVKAGGPIGCHATVFPNFSFLGAFRVLRVWHPRGPHEMEVWSWTLVDKDQSPEIKDAWRRFASMTFGPTGTFEQDDGEIWTDLQRVSRGHIAQTVDLNYQMGIGHEVTDHPDYPGRINHVYSDNAARGFYERWLELMKTPLRPGQRGNATARAGQEVTR